MTVLPAALPDPNPSPLRGGATLRWGVMAPGGIAGAWARTVLGNTDQPIAAVGSRSLERARAFADEHGIAAAYGDYEQVAAAVDVDAVYIATPHSEHHRLALAAIAAGKHVLIEKPMAVDGIQAREIAAAARAAGVFAMEAMWSRYLPQTTIVAQLLADGVLGDIRTVAADFSIVADTDPLGRMYNPKLAGGALLDLGVYPTWFTHFVLGAPESVTAHGTLASTGVDAQAALILGYSGDRAATVTTSMIVASESVAAINGTRARIVYESPYLFPGTFRLVAGDETLRWSDPGGLTGGDGLAYQVAAMAQYVADGLTDSPLHSLDDAIEVIDVLEAARRQLGAI